MSFNSQFDSIRDFNHYNTRANVYMIASTPRSGSHYLGHLMRSTGLMGDPLEYLHSDHFKRWKEIFQTDDLISTFAELYKKRTSRNGIFGLKAHYDQLEKYGGVHEIVKLLGVSKVIFVTRLDKASQAVSYSIANQTQSWISEDPPLVEPIYDYCSIDKCASNVMAQEFGWNDFLRETDLDVMYVSYESLCLSPDIVINQISDFLGVDMSEGKLKIDSSTRKQGRGRSQEWARRFVSEYFSRMNHVSTFGRIKRKLKGFISLR